jgi:hypothetical protein
MEPETIQFAEEIRVVGPPIPADSANAVIHHQWSCTRLAKGKVDVWEEFTPIEEGDVT